MSSHVVRWGISCDYVSLTWQQRADSRKAQDVSLSSVKGCLTFFFFNRKEDSGNNNCHTHRVLMFAIVLGRKQVNWQTINPAVELHSDHAWLAFNNLLKHQYLTPSTETW